MTLFGRSTEAQRFQTDSDLNGLVIGVINDGLHINEWAAVSNIEIEEASLLEQKIGMLLKGRLEHPAHAATPQSHRWRPQDGPTTGDWLWLPLCYQLETSASYPPSGISANH